MTVGFKRSLVYGVIYVSIALFMYLFSPNCSVMGAEIWTLNT
jgi:hypothetical protein